MSESEIIHQAFRIIMYSTAPPLMAAALVGVFVGIIQSAIQVQDQTIGYVIKLAVVCLVLVMMSRWLTDALVGFFDALYRIVPYMGASPS
ncbi:EscS/YscS/HrcS family type III secretion system export apparatus protein [Dyella nitratireducens]|uniref:Type III secretion protein HrcS n=1 Tax=Dyella nitratireducens TaxID=1849580 RepID=A0ABQ1FNU8_9GAMM|nr:flagellar biosynthetic protein FliQ [Dyella nitratireducens]GGA23420.1 type III secretion protein HrcS [Dyella nitratireducens]GLQ43970.1 type III secretion protein HrcS [Dyella nitratireducens]